MPYPGCFTYIVPYSNTMVSIIPLLHIELRASEVLGNLDQVTQLLLISRVHVTPQPLLVRAVAVLSVA